MIYLTYSSNVIEIMESDSEAAETENEALSDDEYEFPVSS
jgi:hypothetical protein